MKIGTETIKQTLKEASEEHVWNIRQILNGGPGSGNFGHAGIPGQVGGSSSGGGGGEQKSGNSKGKTASSEKDKKILAELKAGVADLDDIDRELADMQKNLANIKGLENIRAARSRVKELDAKRKAITKKMAAAKKKLKS